MSSQIKRGPISAHLATLPASARARAKADAMSKLTLNLPHTFTAQIDTDARRNQPLRITVTRLARTGDVLELELAAETNAGGGFQAVKLDNPYLFVNPPIFVPDGTTSTEIIRGREVQVPNLREDLAEALRTIVVDAIRTTAKI
jgi:hypothetical protein